MPYHIESAAARRADALRRKVAGYLVAAAVLIGIAYGLLSEAHNTPWAREVALQQLRADLAKQGRVELRTTQQGPLPGAEARR